MSGVGRAGGAADWKRDDRGASTAPFDKPFYRIQNRAFGAPWIEGANGKGVDDAVRPVTLKGDQVRLSQGQNWRALRGVQPAGRVRPRRSGDVLS